MTTDSKKTICETNKSFYKHWVNVPLRYGDTDRQGHINNAVFATLYESGRTDFLFDDVESIAGEGYAFVIVRIEMDFLNEINYPGTVEVGSSILKIGNSSFRVGQALFKDGECCSTPESIIVLTETNTKKGTKLIEPVLNRLNSISIE